MANRSKSEPRGQRGGAVKESPAQTQSFKNWAWEWIRSTAIALALFFIIRTFVIEAFRIPTGSMEETLLVGDFLLVNKMSYGLRIPGTGARLFALGEPRHGDIIVFEPPHEVGKNYVKRLVGLPGDTLAMRDKVLYRNGQPVIEPYAIHRDGNNDITAPAMMWQREYLAGGVQAGYRPTRDNWGPIVVPENAYFVLGDNRDDSEDSRFWGFVSPSAIKGRPLFVYYSFEPNGTRALPWLTQIRWDRIGSLIR